METAVCKDKILYDCHPQWSIYSKNLILISRIFWTFPTFYINKLAIVGKLLWGFDMILQVWLINLLLH